MTVENLTLRVYLDDGESTTEASYLVDPRSASQNPEIVGRVLRVLGDRVTRALGLPTPEDVDNARRDAEKAEAEAKRLADEKAALDDDAEQAVDPMSLTDRLDRIELEARALGTNLEKGKYAALDARFMREQVQNLASRLSMLRANTQELIQDALEAGDRDAAERLAGHLAMLDAYPLIQNLEG